MESSSSGKDSDTPDSSAIGAQSARDASKSKLTYGDFISLLQSLGIQPLSVRAYRFGWSIGRGTYFAVYQQRVRPTDFHALHLNITTDPVFRRRVPDINDYVAIKRVRVKDETGSIDVSDQGQLQAICQEIRALVHPELRDHDSIVKLQAIIWENGLGAGNESGIPMWPALVMEYCETTLADYQDSHPPLAVIQKSLIASKIGEGLDALHSVNIFHGDLKSENILLKMGQEGKIEPKIADFSCSIIFKDDNRRTKYRVSGTPMWRAPEVMCNASQCPKEFTSIEQVAATDWYSFGLLLLRMQDDGKNPFEELSVIRCDWTTKERSSAVQFMKETDCLPAILREVPENSIFSEAAKMLANLLSSDPTARMKAIDNSADHLEEFLPRAIRHIQQSADGNIHQREIDGLSRQLQLLASTEDVSDADSTEGAYEVLNPFEPFSYFSNSIPDCISLSKMPKASQLNNATRERLVNELRASLDENPELPYPRRCEGCCMPSFLDAENLELNPDSLLDQLQIHLVKNFDAHTCKDLLGPNVSAEDVALSAGIYGGGVSALANRKWRSVHQLYLATATGFGVPSSEHRALQYLQDAFKSGFSGAAALLCLYAEYTMQQINPLLSLRKQLVFLVLFSSGVPSDAFAALKLLDPGLAEITKKARSKVYNGSTASFENRRFNHIDVRSLGMTPLDGFFMRPSGSYVVQDELYQNSLLHLIAGSQHPDTSLIDYCLDVLGIDVDLRNEGGITPLMMACRAGRSSMIRALLWRGADVSLGYPGGETPLHWLGSLAEPGPILKEFIQRGADIHAQVKEPQILANYVGGTGKFFVKGSALFWAVSMNKIKFLNSLLEEGIDINLPGPTGLTAVEYACRPGFFDSLVRLSQCEAYHARTDYAYCLLSQWTTMDMTIKFVKPEEQEATLGHILNSAIPFQNISEVEQFYRYLIPHAVSECRVEIVEILLQALSLSIATLPDLDAELEIYATKPLSNPYWVQHRLVHEATKTGDTEVLRTVLRWGGEATAIDGFQRSTLHTLSFSSNSAECVDILISHGALEVLDMRLEIEKMTAFCNAVACGNFDVASRLLHYTPLEERAKLLSSQHSHMVWYNISVMGHFIAWCADLGEKPIEYLFSRLELHDNPDLVFVVDDMNNRSALMMACGIKSDTTIYDQETFVASRRKKTMALLLKKFPEKRHLDWRDNNNNTALMLAANIGCADMAMQLIDAGADINLYNNLGHSALDMVFAMTPDYLRDNLGYKKRHLQNFEHSRNSMCIELRKRGARHNHPVAVRQNWAARLPRPEVHVNVPLILPYHFLPFGIPRPGRRPRVPGRRDSDVSID